MPFPSYWHEIRNTRPWHTQVQSTSVETRVTMSHAPTGPRASQPAGHSQDLQRKHRRRNPRPEKRDTQSACIMAGARPAFVGTAVTSGPQTAAVTAESVLRAADGGSASWPSCRAGGGPSSAPQWTADPSIPERRQVFTCHAVHSESACPVLQCFLN